MALRAEHQKSELIETVAAFVRQRLPRHKSDAAEQFVRLYYRHVPPDDILSEQSDDLYGAALSLWRFGAERESGTAKIRTYNPQYDEHGWHTSHTIVEIVNDDMSFLVDSVAAALNMLGLTVHLVIHPTIRTVRDADGTLTALCEHADDDESSVWESFMHIEVDEQTSPEALRRIERQLDKVLKDVRRAVTDWQQMRERLTGILTSIEASALPLVPDETRDEIVEFLKWLENDHFTFLGYREYAFRQRNGQMELDIVPDSGLGILRDGDVLVFEGMRRNFPVLPSGIQAFMLEPLPLTVTKANSISPVHRPVLLDTIIVKSFGEDGSVSGERLFVGLFTSTAYNTMPRQIPFLRRKVEGAIRRAGFDSSGHNAKALAHIIDTYPRDELYQIDEDHLLDTAIGILHLQERQRTAMFLRKDPFERFVSCLVFVPRDRYNTDLRERIQRILEKALGGSTSAFYTQLTEGVHARIHFIVNTEPGKLPGFDAREIERQLINAARAWPDHLQDALIDSKGEEAGLSLFRRYGDAFPTSYCERTVPPAAILDIDRIEEVLRGGDIALNLYRPIEAEEHELRFKLYHAGGQVPLSDVLPMLEHMGLKVMAEHPFEVAPADRDEAVFIHDFTAMTVDGSPIDLERVKAPFQTAFHRVWHGEMEDDALNQLVVSQSMDWRQVVVLRAYARFLRQAQISFSQTYVQGTLARHSGVARLVVALFEASFDPDFAGDRAAAVAAIHDALTAALDEVENLNEDRILRRFINLVATTRRTNYYQQADHGGPKPYLSLKLDSRAVDELPKPRPWREIFVYSPRVEGVHLRGGRVARGGIRWSDRHEDFRTEVLDLMKAQMVKNGVIVPVGSKGGFVVKRPPKQGGRDALLAEGIDCYKTFMRGLLDLTDNMDGGAVVPPSRVVRGDRDDPYLVVAADKGTATFSDIANDISRDYGFWLDDAFASGGSAGYDHKGMGITARGAWESVKRLFRELGTDVQNEAFTVIGVGDMSGDVFGNGMLLSEHIRLIAAFNHLHIFVDPDPDAAIGFAERTRLFDLGRGSWDQYDNTRLSKGGAIFSRAAKALPLTPQIRERFGITRASVTPNELIAAILRAEVDLLWFGGIGTYVKATDESHGEVGDKANDTLRVNGRQLHAKVIGEGANLALTQRGRIEAARSGVRLNTDFIDNSAGVDCSDHEVNLKILLGSVVSAGDLTVKQRNELLEHMTDEVAELCLRDNYLQTQAITMAQAEGPELLDQQARFMKALEKAGQLDRAIERLPDDEDLTERLGRREGLTRPEQAVLLSYGKITLYDQLLASALPDDLSLEGDLEQYFPVPVRQRFPAALRAHPLRREIIATYVTNSMVNRVGPTFVAEMGDKTGMNASEIARAYIIVRDSFGLRELWREIEALDNRVEAALQTHMLLAARRLVERATGWVLRYCGDNLAVRAEIDRFKPGIELLIAQLDDIIYHEARAVLEERAAKMAERGVPDRLAHRIAMLNVVSAGLDLIRIGDMTGTSLPDVAPLYFEIGHRLGLAWLRDGAMRMPAASHWQKQAVAAIVDDLYALQTDLTIRVLEAGRPDEPAAAAGGPAAEAAADAAAPSYGRIEAWVEKRRQPVERIDQLIAELRALDHVDLSMLAVATRRLRGLMAG